MKKITEKEAKILGEMCRIPGAYDLMIQFATEVRIELLGDAGLAIAVHSGRQDSFLKLAKVMKESESL